MHFRSMDLPKMQDIRQSQVWSGSLQIEDLQVKMVIAAARIIP